MEIKSCTICKGGVYIWWNDREELYIAECGKECYGYHRSPTLSGAIQLWNEAQGDE